MEHDLSFLTIAIVIESRVSVEHPSSLHCIVGLLRQPRIIVSIIPSLAALFYLPNLFYDA